MTAEAIAKTIAAVPTICLLVLCIPSPHSIERAAEDDCPSEYYGQRLTAVTPTGDHVRCTYR